MLKKCEKFFTKFLPKMSDFWAQKWAKIPKIAKIGHFWQK